MLYTDDGKIQHTKKYVTFSNKWSQMKVRVFPISSFRSFLAYIWYMKIIIGDYTLYMHKTEPNKLEGKSILKFKAIFVDIFSVTIIKE